MSSKEYQELQELFINVKPFLRFRCGDVVFLKTDSSRRNPMCVHKIIDPFLGENGDYIINFFDSQKCLKFESVFDIALIPKDK